MIFSRRQPAYAWVIVAMSFLAQFAGSGFIYYCFSVVVVSLSKEFADGNRTPIILLQLAMGIVAMLMSPVIGRMAGRGHSRAILSGGLLATGLGLVLASQAQSLTLLAFLFASLIAFGSSALMGAGATTMIVNWFDERRGTAFGIANVGASAAGVVLTPLAATLIESSGWRGTLLAAGCAAIVMTAVAWLLVVDHPPGSRAPTPGKPNPSPESRRSALLQPKVWLIGVTGGLALMCSTAFLAHVVAFGYDIGLTPVNAAYLGSIFAAGGVAGKLLFGRLSDRIGVRPAFNLALLSSSASFVALSLVDGYPATAVLVFVLAMGCSGSLPLTNALVAVSFPPREFGWAIGNIWPVVQAIIIAGPIFASLLFDLTGSYSATFVALGVALAGAAAVLNFVPRA